MQGINFFVKGAPKAWKRPRVNRKTGAFYTAPEDERWRNSIWGQAMPHAPDEPWTGPISVTLRFHLPVPASWPKWKRAWVLRHDCYPDGRPDADNLAKAVLDALKGVFFQDDRQVSVLDISKVYWGMAVGVRVQMGRLPGIPDTLAEAKARENRP